MMRCFGPSASTTSTSRSASMLTKSASSSSVCSLCTPPLTGSCARPPSCALWRGGCRRARTVEISTVHDPFPLAGVVLGGVVNARRRGSLSLRARRRCRLSPHPAPRLFSSCSGVVDREERGVSYDSIIMMYHVSYRTYFYIRRYTVGTCGSRFIPPRNFLVITHIRCFRRASAYRDK